MGKGEVSELRMSEWGQRTLDQADSEQMDVAQMDVAVKAAGGGLGLGIGAPT